MTDLVRPGTFSFSFSFCRGPTGRAPAVTDLDKLGPLPLPLSFSFCLEPPEVWLVAAEEACDAEVLPPPLLAEAVFTAVFPAAEAFRPLLGVDGLVCTRVVLLGEGGFCVAGEDSPEPLLLMVVSLRALLGVCFLPSSFLPPPGLALSTTVPFMCWLIFLHLPAEEEGREPGRAEGDDGFEVDVEVGGRGTRWWRWRRWPGLSEPSEEVVELLSSPRLP